MGYKTYKNKLKLNKVPDPIERRENITKEVLKDTTILPKPLGYKDIDIAFKDWVENDLGIVYEGKKLDTIALFSNQRFSEYMQSWENTDNDKNMMLNFKVITRENNPSQGTMQGGNMNIPGDIDFLMKKVIMNDKNGRPYILEYRMKQPYCVDLNYTVSVVTNKYNLLNEFNMMVNNKFKTIQCYIAPNGCFMPMKLENITDESEYNLNDRQFFSQSFEITVQAYIISEDDFRVEEKPIIRFSCFDVGTKSSVDMIEEEEPVCPPHNPYYYQGVTLKIDFDPCEEMVEFNLPIPMEIIDITTENLISYKLYIGNILIEETPSENTVSVKEGDKISIRNAKKRCKIDSDHNPTFAHMTIRGYNPKVVFDKNLDNPESELDVTQEDIEYVVNEKTH